MSLDSPITSLKGVSTYFSSRLKNLGIFSVRDLIYHFPYRYEDFSHIVPIKELQAGKTCTIHAKVLKVSQRRVWKRKMTVTEARVEDESGKISLVWFNQSYIAKSLKEGSEMNFSGKVIARGEVLQLINPLSEAVHSGETRHTARIVPVYPETRGLTSKGIRFILQPVLNEILVPDIVPEQIREKEKLLEVNEALRNVHFPNTIGEGYNAKKRFAFEDLLLLALHIAEERARAKKEQSASIKVSVEEIKKILELIPFELTEAQKRTLWEVVKDMSESHPMHRLIQGGVGSGKTIVAALAMLFASERGYQSALMAPTEILARQHYRTLTSLFGEQGHGIGLLVSHEAKIHYGGHLETEIKKDAFLREVKAGNIKMVIGTHAVIQKSVAFKNLVLAAVDEQHRFGVSQRANLLKKNLKTEFSPHFLSMSATPIPRTLSLSVFGELDLSLVDELPKNRKPIHTRVVPTDERSAAYRGIRNQIKEGRQAFVVCPRIEPPEETVLSLNDFQKLEIKSVKDEYEKLSKKIFPDLKVSMLHGKLKAQEKEKIMRDFADGKTDVLVSTSVVEVGIDVPNATVMMIEDAERFGLAQLYQFRGRVGRGAHQSYCFLFTQKDDEKTRERLSYLERARNGFELAEFDLKTRGPGELFGISQSGIPDLAMKALQNPEMLKKAKFWCDELLKEDKTLKTYPLIREHMKEFAKEIHPE